MSAVIKEEIFPKDWVMTSIGDVAEDTMIGIVRSKALQNVEGNGVPYLKMNNVTMGGVITKDDLVFVEVSEDELKKYTIQEGDILFNTRNSSELVGKTGIANKNVVGFVYNNNLMRIRTKEGISSKYIAYQMISPTFRKNMEKVKRATTNIAAVYAKDLLPLPIYLAPPEQQKLIVAKIEELFSHIDAGIEALNKAKKLLKQYRQSILKAAVTGELTREWREANKDKLEPASELLERILKERRQKWEEQQLEQFKAKGKLPKDDKWKEKYKEPADFNEWNFLCELPKSWVWTSVAQIGDSKDQPVLTGPFGSNLGKKDFINTGVPVLTIGCLKEAGIVLTKAMHVSEKKAGELERYKLKDGDMLFSRMAAVGRAGHVNKELEGCLFNYHIMRLRLHSEAILQNYFIHYVRGSNQVYEYVKEVNHGATRDGINTQQLLEMPVALPPLDEQYQICLVVKEKLESIRRLDMDIEYQLKKAEKNKQSILMSAFCGTLREKN